MAAIKKDQITGNNSQENDISYRETTQIPNSNIEMLIEIAKEQHTERINDIETLNKKLGILFAAIGAVLITGSKLPWFESNAGTVLGIFFFLFLLLTFFFGLLAFMTRYSKDVNTASFKEKHAKKSPEIFHDLLLSAYNDCISSNVKKNVSVHGFKTTEMVPQSC